MLKQIYIKEGLQPPSIETIKQVYSSLWKQFSSPGALKSILEGQDLAKLGVYGVQAYGIYKVRPLPSNSTALNSFCRLAKSSVVAPSLATNSNSILPHCLIHRAFRPFRNPLVRFKPRLRKILRRLPGASKLARSLARFDACDESAAIFRE